MVQFGFNLPNFGDYRNPRLMAQLAKEAEDAGWDGFFIWDHINWPWLDEHGDPWIILALMAAATERIKIGPMVTPLPRRHPWKLARETVTLDHLSNGRLIMGVGIGGDSYGNDFNNAEFRAFGDHSDARTRAEKLDEGLQVLTSLWTGEKFSFEGKHYTIDNVQFIPKPVQQPRIPIWVAGTWPIKRPARRAAQWDGYTPIMEELKPATAADVREMLAYISQHRTTDAPFDLMIGGSTPGDDPAAARDIVGPLADAGMTWWNEGLLPWASTLDDVRRRIAAGPPRL